MASYAKKVVKPFDELCNPTDRQREFWAAVKAHMFTLYGGAAGGGKSYILRWTALGKLINWASKGFKNVRAGLFCEDYPTLKDRHLSKIKFEFPAELGTYRESDHDFILRKEYGGGVISFRNLDDVSKYLSSEFALIAVDELTMNDRHIFDFLRMRLRWPGIEDPKFIAGTNPGGPGHGWVRALWIDRVFPPELTPLADQFAFVPAKIADNPHLPQAYAMAMQTLPEALRKAYTEGSWDVFAGQVFTEWDREKHVVEPFEIPKGWIRFVSMDWGFSKPYAVQWHAVDFDGNIWTYRELYGWNGTPDCGSQETASDVAKKIKAIEHKTGEDIRYRVADPAIWSKTGTGPSIGEEFSRKGIYWEKADNDRLQGKNQCHERLRSGTWKCFSTCQHLIRTLPSLVYDKRKVEDVDTTQEDHLYDQLRYAFQSRPMKPTKAEAAKKRDKWAFDDEENKQPGWMGA